MTGRSSWGFGMGKVYIGQTRKTGKGIFAESFIKKGDPIFIWKGRLVIQSYSPTGAKVGQRWLGMGRNLWLKSDKSNPGYYINHSCRPNAGFRGSVTVVAMRDIKKGKEITIDYSMTEEDPWWRMQCQCGQRSCRKLIRSIQFLPRNVFERYRSFMKPFFVKSYEKSGKDRYA